MRAIIAAAAIGLAVGVGAGLAADEISIAASLQCVNGDLFVQKNLSGGLRVTQNTARRVGGTQALTTNAAAIALGDLDTPGIGWYRNLSTNYVVQVGAMDANTNFVMVIQLGAREVALFRLGSAVVPYARTASGTALLDYEILDD